MTRQSEGVDHYLLRQYPFVFVCVIHSFMFRRLLKLVRPVSMIGGAAIAATIAGATLYGEAQQRRWAFADAGISSGEFRKDLPIYTRADVASHKTPETGIWVSFKSGVYDITNFVEVHPGGTKINMAFGGAIDPFWMVY
jgi:hypothetical protein